MEYFDDYPLDWDWINVARWLPFGSGFVALYSWARRRFQPVKTRGNEGRASYHYPVITLG